jgi:AraC-like DNA-binding protein
MLFGAAYFWIMGLAMGRHPLEYFYVELYNKIILFTLPFFSGYLLYKTVKIADQFTTELKEEQVMIKRISTVISIIIFGFFFFAIYIWATDHPYSITNVFARSALYTGMLSLCLTIIIYKLEVRERKASISLVDNTGKDWGVSFSIETSMPVNEKKELLPASEKEFNRPSLLSPEKQKAIYMAVEEIVRNRKLFLDEDFNLDKLAVATTIQRQYISEALNQYAQKSFYQFINGYRIEAVIARMEKLKHQTITINLTTLAFDCGFKSKAPFNQYFKKHTGLTPSEYMERLRKQEKLELLKH